jgi:capsule polysaccharide export protein KpsE/RkpR
MNLVNYSFLELGHLVLYITIFIVLVYLSIFKNREYFLNSSIEHRKVHHGGSYTTALYPTCNATRCGQQYMMDKVALNNSLL